MSGDAPDAGVCESPATVEGILVRHCAYGIPGYGENPATDARERLFDGHGEAFLRVMAAIRALRRTSDPNVSDALDRYFGNGARQTANRDIIQSRFFDIRAALLDPFDYVCKPNHVIECSAGKQATVWPDELDTIYFCHEGLGAHTEAGMAALIIHETLHRLGFFETTPSIDPANAHLSEFRDNDRGTKSTGECLNPTDPVRPGIYDQSVGIVGLANADSYACFAAWALRSNY